MRGQALRRRDYLLCICRSIGSYIEDGHRLELVSFAGGAPPADLIESLAGRSSEK